MSEIGTQAKWEHLVLRAQRLEGKVEDLFRYQSKSPVMAKLQDWLTSLRKEAMRGEPEAPLILLAGELGTEKEGVARAIYSGSRRGRGPWISLHCGEWSGQKFEAEIFGYEKGSFEGATQSRAGLLELAEGGTFFMDAVEFMDFQMQGKFLKLLQENIFHRIGNSSPIQPAVRFIVGSSHQIEEYVREGKLREDLYQLLKQVSITIPPLRERKEDIIPLAFQFGERAFRHFGKHFQGFSQEVEGIFKSYSWPGNVHELFHVIECAALAHRGKEPVQVASVMMTASTSVLSSGGESNGPKLQLIQNGDSYMEIKRKWSDSFEIEYLKTTLSRNGGNVSAAAREAKLDRSNFLRLLRRHGLKAQIFRKAA